MDGMENVPGVKVGALGDGLPSTGRTHGVDGALQGSGGGTKQGSQDMLLSFQGRGSSQASKLTMAE